jgi:hypothetical protein
MSCFQTPLLAGREPPVAVRCLSAVAAPSRPVIGREDVMGRSKPVNGLSNACQSRDGGLVTDRPVPVIGRRAWS